MPGKVEYANADGIRVAVFASLFKINDKECKPTFARNVEQIEQAEANQQATQSQNEIIQMTFEVETVVDTETSGSLTSGTAMVHTHDETRSKQ
eukprot:140968-Amphidinium_carterae.1